MRHLRVAANKYEGEGASRWGMVIFGGPASMKGRWGWCRVRGEGKKGQVIAESGQVSAP